MAGSLLKPLLLAGSLALLLAGLVPSPSLPADAPETAAPYWVFLRAADDSQGSRPLALSERAVRRLGKMGCTAGSDPRDRAVSWQVLAPLRERGVRIRTLSRWFHAATALLTPAERSVLERDLRVAGLQPVRRFVRPFEPEQTGSLPLEIRIGEPS